MLGFQPMQARHIKVRRMNEGAYVDGVWTTSAAQVTTHLAMVRIGKGSAMGAGGTPFRSVLNFGDVENFAEGIMVTLNDGFAFRIATERDVADIVIIDKTQYKVMQVDNRPHWGYCKGWAERLPEDAGFFQRRPKG